MDPDMIIHFVTGRAPSDPHSDYRVTEPEKVIANVAVKVIKAILPIVLPITPPDPRG